jgi:hypothetical protein
MWNEHETVKIYIFFQFKNNCKKKKIILQTQSKVIINQLQINKYNVY